MPTTGFVDNATATFTNYAAGTAEERQRRMREMVIAVRDQMRNFELFAPRQVVTESHVRSTLWESGSVLQPFQTAFTPSNSAITTDAWERPLQEIKSDELITPDLIRNTYFDFLRTLDVQSRSEWPAIRWFVENFFMPMHMQDVYNNFYSAVYVAPTPGTPGPVATSFDGLRVLIADAIAAAFTAPIVTGALTPATIVDQVQDFCATIPVQVRQRFPELGLFISDTNYTMYITARDGLDNLYHGKTTREELNKPWAYPNVRVYPLTMLEGTDAMICQPMGNVRHVLRDNESNVKFQEFDRSVKFMWDYEMRAWIRDPRYIYVNDQY